MQTVYIRMIFNIKKNSNRIEFVDHGGHQLTKEQLENIPAGQYKAIVREVIIEKED